MNSPHEGSSRVRSLPPVAKYLLMSLALSFTPYSSALKQKDLTEQAIARYIKLRDALKERSLSVDNLPAVIALLDNCQQLGYEPAKIVKELTTKKDIRAVIEQLQHEVKSMQKQKEMLDIKIAENQRMHETLEEQLASQGSLMRSIRKIKDAKIEDHNIIAIEKIISSYPEPLIDIGLLLDSLKQYKSVAAINEALSTQNAELKGQRVTLAEDVKYWQKQEQQLEKRVEKMFEMISRYLEQFQKEAIEAITLLRDAKSNAISAK